MERNISLCQIKQKQYIQKHQILLNILQIRIKNLFKNTNKTAFQCDISNPEFRNQKNQLSLKLKYYLLINWEETINQNEQFYQNILKILDGCQAQKDQRFKIIKDLTEFYYINMSFFKTIQYLKLNSSELLKKKWIVLRVKSRQYRISRYYIQNFVQYLYIKNIEN
ncbi:unnamed protein product [Paramecium sonneborni]|uniref:Uncharacterized protein n=1 Tax=Paramecium sonneborni TaxID=65129 RepID=A0A8S1QQM8_9CILI|nr:unnamed protein product [Paramecium sonneborni]